MTLYLIAQNHDGLPLFYSPRAGRGLGAGGGWTEKAEDGLAFAREKDAQLYLEYHLGHVQFVSSIVRREMEPCT